MAVRHTHHQAWRASSAVTKLSFIALVLGVMHRFDLCGFLARADESANIEGLGTLMAEGESFYELAAAPRSPAERTEEGIYTKCGFESTDRFLSRDNFETWFKVLSTNSPVLFPQDDQELTYIVTTAKANGCKVRVRGAGHSEDGVVMQKLDELDDYVVVINLKDYAPSDASWNGVIDPTKPSVKISAGASSLKMLSVIRPQGYLTTTNTAGRFFSVGGVYMNPSVHGAAYGESRYAAQVLSVRVMNADGQITEYSGEDVKVFRGSMGLLGIVTALEIRIQKDAGLKMTHEAWAYQSNVRSFFQRKLSKSDNDGTEFFYWVYDDIIDAFSVDFDGNPGMTPDSTIEAWYERRLQEFPNLAYSGGTTDILGDIAQWISDNTEGKKLAAKILAIFGRPQVIQQHDAASIAPRDGYFVDGSQVAKFESIHYSVKCSTDCLDEMTELFETTRTFLIETSNDKGAGWVPTLPLEWRVFEVQEDEMLLEHLSKGTYLSWENVAFMVEGETTYSKFHKQLEDMWRNRFPGGGIHHGKAYAYGPVPGVGEPGEEFPFQDDTILDDVYSQDVRDKFIEKMDLYDPSHTFRAGSVLRLLGLTDKKYTPKKYVGESCYDFKNSECIDACCCTDPVCFLEYNKCVAPGVLDNEERCFVDCQCKSNKCRRKFLFFGKKCRA